MKKKNKFSIEFIIAILIASLLIISLLFEGFFSTMPDYIIFSLFVVYLIFKIVHIIKVKGTIFEDYVSLFIILILAVLRFLTVHKRINITMIVISILTILYSVRLIPSIKKISNSQTISTFLISYAIFIFAIIFLFAGAYTTSGNSFIGEGFSSELKFNDALYFSTITFTSTGYGDIAPIGINRIIASFEALTGLILNIAVIGYILASKRFKKFRK